MWHDAFICVAWLIHICDMTHSTGRPCHRTLHLPLRRLARHHGLNFSKVSLFWVYRKWQCRWILRIFGKIFAKRVCLCFLRICMCTCIRVYIYNIFMYAWVLKDKWNMDMYVYIYIYAYICKYMYVYIYIHIYIYICMYICIYLHIYIYRYIYIYIYISIYI